MHILPKRGVEAERVRSMSYKIAMNKALFMSEGRRLKQHWMMWVFHRDKYKEKKTICCRSAIVSRFTSRSANFSVHTAGTAQWAHRLNPLVVSRTESRHYYADRSIPGNIPHIAKCTFRWRVCSAEYTDRSNSGYWAAATWPNSWG